MDQVHIHLLITHLPVFGSLLGGFVLAYGIWNKSDPTKRAGFYVLIFAALGAVVSYLTGEGAEEVAEEIQGVAKNMIHQHEDFAAFALAGLSVVGATSIVGLYLSFRKSTYANLVAAIVLLLVIISFGLVARTAYLGGQIRHTELTTGTSQPELEGNDD